MDKNLKIENGNLKIKFDEKSSIKSLSKFANQNPNLPMKIF